MIPPTTGRPEPVTFAALRSSAFFSHVEGTETRGMDGTLDLARRLLHSLLHGPWESVRRWNRSAGPVATMKGHRVHMVLKNGEDVDQPMRMTDIVVHGRSGPVGSITMPSGIHDPADPRGIDMSHPLGYLRRLAREAFDVLDPARIVMTDWPTHVREAHDRLIGTAGLIATIDGLTGDARSVITPGPWSGSFLTNRIPSRVEGVSEQGLSRLADIDATTPHAVIAMVDPNQGGAFDILLAQRSLGISPPDPVTAMRAWATTAR